MKNSISYLDYLFTGLDIQRASIIQETSLPIDALSIDTIEATVRCDDDLSGYHQNDPLVLSRDDVPVGTFYLQEIRQVNANHWTITAVSKTGLLDQVHHRGGIYTGATAQDVANEICSPYPVIVKRDIASQQIFGYLPIATARENLQQLLFAIGANLTIDRNNVFRIANLWDGITAYFTEDDMFSGASVKTDAPVSAVTVVEHAYNVSSETTELFSGDTYSGQVVTFDNPATNLVGDGIQIVESGANYAIVGAGSGTITGNPYVHTTREVTDVVNENAAENVKSVSDATLVTVTNAAAVTRRLAEYYSAQKSIEAGLSIRRREHTGQVAKIIDPWTRELFTATLFDNDISVSSTIKGNAKVLVDFTPPQSDAYGAYDTAEVLTGSGTFAVPEGVTSIAVVLIGGGHGGDGGYDGENGGLAFPERVFQRPDKVAGDSGDGGDGGDGGVGGNILTINLEVEVGDTFSYACGTGGVGGAKNGGTGSAGTATVFNGRSSDEGLPSIEGVTNPLTGIVYGKRGGNGVRGAKGGSVQSDAQGRTVYYNGENVTYSGTVYNGGTSGGDYSYNAGYGYSYTIYGGLGGGASAGSNGQNAYIDYNAHGLGGQGGKGGDGAVTSVGNYGSGGQGGHGGGGGGGGGYTKNNDNVWGIYYDPNQFGVGGEGSAGANGGDGCVIVLYRIAPVQAHGGMFERKSRYFIDRTGRLMVT